MACVVVRQLQSQCLFYLAQIILLAYSKASEALNTFPMSQPKYCPNSCGNIVIPYPFGTSPGCFRDGFEITCNDSTTPPKAFLGNTSLPLIDINLTSGESYVSKDIDYRCYNQSNQIYDYHREVAFEILDYPYYFSHKRNKFTVVGCYSLAFITYIPFYESNQRTYQSGCGSSCSAPNSPIDNNDSCNGLGCCQTSIPSRLSYYFIAWGSNENLAWQFSPCTYVFLAQEDWYRFQNKDLSGETLKQSKTVQVVLDWAIIVNDTSCQNGVEKSPNPFCISQHNTCHTTSNGDGYLCSCLQGYEGNPYITDGCIDIDECKFPSIYPCKGICIKKEGSYNCPCKKGAKGDAKDGNCAKNCSYPARVAIFSIVEVIALIGICLLVVAYRRHKRHIKEKEEYQRYYQMMKNQLRVFSKRQIQIATNNFAETHVLGVRRTGKGVQRVFRGYSKRGYKEVQGI